MWTSAPPEPAIEALTSAQDYSAPVTERRHFYDYLKVVYKRRWPAATLFAIWLIGVIVTNVSTVPVYRATAQVLIDKESTNVVTFKQAIEQNQTTDDYYQTQYRMLQSRALARRTIETAGLWTQPVLNPRPVASWSPGRAAPPQPAPPKRRCQTRRVASRSSSIVFSPA
jgi:uncharacterized protein involved in exopolysaccharide biosynthesis